MNVLQMADFSAEQIGCFGASMMQVTKELISRGHNSYILLPARKWWLKDFEAVGMKPIILPNCQYPMRLSYIIALNRIIRDNNISLAHIHFGSLHPWSVSLLKLFAIRRIPLVVHWRGGPARPNYAKARLGSLWYRIIDRYAVSAHIANSSLIYNQMLDLKIANPRKLLCLHNGIDTEHFSPDRTDSLRHELGIPEEAFVVLHVRNFRDAVDFDLVIEAQYSLSNRSPKQIYFIYVGDGPKRGYVESKLNSYRGTTSVFTGIRHDVERFYATADLVVSSYEPWCGESINNSVYESLAMGKPIVGVNTGALNSLFSEDDGVLAVRPEPDAFTDAILEVMRNWSKWETSARIVGRKHILESYSVEAWAAYCVDVYEYIAVNTKNNNVSQHMQKRIC